MECLEFSGYNPSLYFGFAALMATNDIEDTKNNWASRRCDIDVMMMANLYKPQGLE